MPPRYTRGMGTFEIAPAELADCPRCAELLRIQLAEHSVQVRIDDLLPVLERIIAEPKLGFLLVARSGPRVVGVAYAASLFTAEHCGFISSLEELYVDEDSRANGAGTALLNAVVEEAEARGHKAIILEVDANHSRVARLYERFGFRQLDRSRWVRKPAKG